jgi:chromosome transmission fidelity protein 1
MLNPAVHFEPVVAQARSVILLGGTMQPFSLFRSHLLPQVPESRMRFFSCGHVVNKRNVYATVLPCGPGKQEMSLTFSKRMSVEVTNDIFDSLLGVCQNTPHGVVAFFTSYAYLELLVARWKAGGRLERLKAVKHVFVEPRSLKTTSISTSNSGSSKEERDAAVWEGYCAAAKKIGGAGAILFSVIGGRLSEGINFSDDLARAVVVVGMPYPDRRDAVLQEKLKHANSVQAGSADKLYEAMCMKAVNQSIGRAIRHKDDYAAIVLMDARYKQANVRAQLPSWIAECMVNSSSSDGSGDSNFEGNLARLRAFFALHTATATATA